MSLTFDPQELRGRFLMAEAAVADLLDEIPADWSEERSEVEDFLVQLERVRREVGDVA